ncbi:lipid A export permease/ATP-binding protein MsbA [Paludibacterium paludis]|nr:lipid A export permease/ATP-binding protein MsbA [Paludibacterium paludis]
MNGKRSYKSLGLYLRMMGYLRPYWGVFVISLVSMSIAAATEPAFTTLMKPLIDQGFVAKDNTTITWVPLAIVCLFLVRGITSFINEYSTSWLAGKLVMGLRNEMFQRLVNMPSAFYKENQSAHLLSRITYDAGMVTDAGFNIITVSIKDGIQVIGLIGVMFYTDWQLSLICLTVFPMVALCIRIVSKRLRRLSSLGQKQMASLTQVLSESIDCERVVKIYGGQEREISRFDSAAQAIRRNWIKQTSAISSNTSVTQLIIAVALSFVLYFATMRAQQNALTAGAFMTFLTSMTMLFAPIKRITNISQSLQRGLSAAESVFSFLDQSVEEDAGTIGLKTVAGRIEFDHVSFRYPSAERLTLDDVSFTIEPGETVALVGASGSGKTTLASLIPRFYLPSQGIIRLDGVPLGDWVLKDLRSHIALVSQDVLLFNDTVEANIAYGRQGKVDRAEIEAAARAANALEFIEQLPDGFDTVIGENGSRLSGGQRQRLAIARALLKNASILILDEATSALDSHSEMLVQSALDKLMANQTTLVIAHRLSTIENANRIVVMDQGRIVETGSHPDLLAHNGVYANLHRIQFKSAE